MASAVTLGMDLVQQDDAFPPDVLPTEDAADWYDQQSQLRLGLPYLYPYQRLIVDYCVRQSLREPPSPRTNLLALLPTGAGKSACFTLPALLLPHPTLVIYPLRSLLFDQQRRLEESGIASSLLVGGQSRKQRRRHWERVHAGAKMLLTNPETLLQPEVVRQLSTVTCSQIVLDEAHTLVEWGESFRPAYLELARWLQGRQELLCAYTATASPRICQGLERWLLGRNYYRVEASADRPNIHYQVRPVLDKTQAIIQLLTRCLRPALVFAARRARCESLAYQLRLHTASLECRYYHAGLPKEEKQAVERWFHRSTSGVLVATCAYGMGVDKSDIRTVIHDYLPRTFEAYLQESGRAGRDRAPARAVLLYQAGDLRGSSPLKHTVLHPQLCRRSSFLAGLGQTLDHCAGCDACLKTSQPLPADWEELRGVFRRFGNSLSAEQACLFLQGLCSRDPLLAPLVRHRYFARYAYWPWESLLHAWESAPQWERIASQQNSRYNGA